MQRATHPLSANKQEQKMRMKGNKESGSVDTNTKAFTVIQTKTVVGRLQKER
jgi:hypothetical protein